MTISIVKSSYFLAVAFYTGVFVEVVEMPASAWTPDKITTLLTAIFAGLALLVTAIAGLIVAVVGLYRKTHETAKKTEEVHAAVNGNNRALLLRVDRLTSRIADFTGKPIDIEESEAAHAEVVANADLPQNKDANGSS